MPNPGCLFCRIAAREIPSDIVHEDDRAVAFRDIQPQAPVHVLIVPREHLPSLAEAEERHAPLLGHLLCLARVVAGKLKLSKNEYRVVVNTGPSAGQSVFHVHAHLLGGRAFSWPPG